MRAVPEVNGVKTGHTSTAGYILVGSASKDGITVISVVLDEPSEAARDQDSLALIRYGLGRYHRATPVRKGQAFASVKLAHRDERAQLVAARTVVRTRAARGAPARSACSTCPASSTARCRRDRGWGRSRSAGAGGRSRACRS